MGVLLVAIAAMPPFLLIGRSSVDPVAVATGLELAYPPSSFRDLAAEDDWALVATYTSDVCPPASEGVVLWHNAYGEVPGDPSIEVKLCRSMSAPLAWLTRLMASAEDEAVMQDLRDVVPYEAKPMEAPDNLMADASEFSCVWGNDRPAPCRLAMFRARYGSHLLTVQFVGLGSGYVVSEEAFGSFIADLDAQVASALRP